MKNYADRRGCYQPRLKAEVDNILRDLQNSSHRTAVIISSKYLSVLDMLSPRRLFSKLWPISRTVSGCKQLFFLADTPQTRR